MKNIVVTYFEPFGERNTNASMEVVSLLTDFQTKELPVSWNRVSPCIDEILANEPDYLFLVGEAGSYKQITIERVAHNTAKGIDNDGVNKNDEPIVNDGEDLFTKFDLNGLSFSTSENAGKYLCNYTYYLALIRAKKTKVLFIHLPYICKEEPNTLNGLKDDLLNIINTLIK